MSAIVISRKDGDLISGSLTDEERKELAFQVFRAFCQSHQDMIAEALSDNNQPRQ